MVSSARPAALRWALLAALVFGLLCMHSLVAHDPGHPSHESVTMAGASAQGMPVADSPCCPDHDSSGHGHDMMHLCLAVLVAVAGLAIGWLLWRRGRTAAERGGRQTMTARFGRGPPPLCVDDVLASLCVLRL
ncbi:DUF6153 family protein [Kutzneria sp. CA-103260]|uniref:DUF6153 family protein n=1 Tax=Kutzneria sp. CA-103260 TaxID=2802641 RepID=UPI001BA98D88|nr:DUF6153 family protein [Kutzneria sp. CA-103260]